MNKFALSQKVKDFLWTGVYGYTLFLPLSAPVPDELSPDVTVVRDGKIMDGVFFLIPKRPFDTKHKRA